MTALIAVIYYPAIIPAYGRGHSGLYLPLLPRPLRDPLTSKTLNEQGLVTIRPREKTAGEIIAGIYSDKFGTDIQQTRFFLDTRVGPPLSRDSLVLSCYPEDTIMAISKSAIDTLKAKLSAASEIVTPDSEKYADSIKRWSTAAEKPAVNLFEPSR